MTTSSHGKAVTKFTIIDLRITFLFEENLTASVIPFRKRGGDNSKPGV